MNRTIYAMLLVVIVVSAAATVSLAHAATEGIVNGGFETGTLTGWTTSLPAALESVNVHSGVYAIEMYQYLLMQTFSSPIIPAGDLIVWVYSGNEVYYGLRAEVNYGDGSVSLPTLNYGSLQAGEWNRFTFQIDDAKAVTKITLFLQEFGATIYVDDISLLAEPTPKFTVPEVPFGTILAAVSMLTAFGAYLAVPRLRAKTLKTLP